MAWRLARSLDTLRSEVWALHPGTTFWTIGDPAHADTWSDHNPNECCGVVCAADVLGNAGLNLRSFADTIVRVDPPALKYVIFNRKIWHPGYGWSDYHGSNPHTTHVHVSVGFGPDGRSTGNYDDRSGWGIAEENDMQPTDQIPIPDWMLKRWPGIGGGDQEMMIQSALSSGYGWSRAVHEQNKEVLAGQTAILAAVKGDDAPAIQEIIRAELKADADRERTERAAELEAMVGPMAVAVAAAVDHTLDTAAVEEALRRVLGSLDGV